MPSFAISKFTVLLGPLWVSAEFLLLSTGSLLYIIDYRLGSSTDCTEGSLTRSLGCLLSRAVIKRLLSMRGEGLTLTLYRNPLCVRAPTDSQRKTAPHNGGTVLLRLVIKRSQWDKQGSNLA